MLNTHEVAVRALVPLVVASVTGLVVVASATGSIDRDLVVLLPSIADAEWSTTDRLSGSFVDADSGAVQIGRRANEGCGQYIAPRMGYSTVATYRGARAEATSKRVEAINILLVLGCLMVWWLSVLSVKMRLRWCRRELKGGRAYRLKYCCNAATTTLPQSQPRSGMSSASLAVSHMHLSEAMIRTRDHG